MKLIHFPQKILIESLLTPVNRTDFLIDGEGGGISLIENFLKSRGDPYLYVWHLVSAAGKVHTR